LDLRDNHIQGHRGGEVLRNLLLDNNSIIKLDLRQNLIGPEGAIGLGLGLPGNMRLQKLGLMCCGIENDGLESLLPAGDDDGSRCNHSLTFFRSDVQ
jgi:Leucine Rich repeat